MADCCLDEYTDHGHCGVLDPATGEVDNDATARALRRAGRGPGRRRRRRRGAQRDDGRPGGRHPRPRSTAAGHTETAVLAYAAKYASALYGPFRDAVDVTIAGGGDRRGLPAGPAQPARGPGRGRARRGRGSRHGHGQAGADLPRRARRRARAASTCPLAAYHVSGEYAMVKAAAAARLDRRPRRRPRAAHRGQAGRRRLRPHLLRRRGGRGARWLSRLPAPSSDAAPREASVRRAGAAGSSPAASTRRSARSARSAALPTSSPGARAPTCGTSTATGYIDFVQSYGASILGHAHPAVVAAVTDAAAARARPSARRPRARSCWPRPSAPGCPAASRCGWSPRGPRPP